MIANRVSFQIFNRRYYASPTNTSIYICGFFLNKLRAHQYVYYESPISIQDIRDTLLIDLVFVRELNCLYTYVFLTLLIYNFSQTSVVYYSNSINISDEDCIFLASSLRNQFSTLLASVIYHVRMFFKIILT